MTVISEPIVNIAGGAGLTFVTFFVENPRRRASGHGIVSKDRVDAPVVNKVLTTPDLNPGPAVVQLGGKSYDITIPDTTSIIPLWPLIEAGQPAPSPRADFVTNGGGITRAEVMSLAAYAALPLKDPETAYLLHE